MTTAEPVGGEHLSATMEDFDGGGSAEKVAHARRGSVGSDIRDGEKVARLDRGQFDLFRQAIERGAERTDDIDGDGRIPSARGRH